MARFVCRRGANEEWYVRFPLFKREGRVNGFDRGMSGFVSVFLGRGNCIGMIRNLRGALLVTVANLVVNVIVNALVTAIHIVPGCGALPEMLGRVYDFCITLFEKAPVMIRLLVFCCMLLPVFKMGVAKIRISVIMFNLGDNTCVSRVVQDKVRSISRKRVRTKETIKLDFKADVVGVIVPRTIGGVLPALKGRFVSLVGRASMMDFINTTSLCITFGFVKDGDCRFVIPCLIVTLVCVTLILIVALLIGLLREDLGGDSEHGWSTGGL